MRLTLPTTNPVSMFRTDPFPDLHLHSLTRSPLTSTKGQHAAARSFLCPGQCWVRGLKTSQGTYHGIATQRLRHTSSAEAPANQSCRKFPRHQHARLAVVTPLACVIH